MRSSRFVAAALMVLCAGLGVAPAFAAAEYRYSAVPGCPAARAPLARVNAILMRDQTRLRTQAEAFAALGELGRAYHVCSSDDRDVNGGGEDEVMLAKTRLAAEAAGVFWDACRRGLLLTKAVPAPQRATLHEAVAVFAKAAFIDGRYAERFGNDDAVVERGRRAAAAITSLVKENYPKRAAAILADPSAPRD